MLHLVLLAQSLVKVSTILRSLTGSIDIYPFLSHTSSHLLHTVLTSNLTKAVALLTGNRKLSVFKPTGTQATVPTLPLFSSSPPEKCIDNALKRVKIITSLIGYKISNTNIEKGKWICHLELPRLSLRSAFRHTCQFVDELKPDHSKKNNGYICTRNFRKVTSLE